MRALTRQICLIRDWVVREDTPTVSADGSRRTLQKIAPRAEMVLRHSLIAQFAHADVSPAASITWTRIALSGIFGNDDGALGSRNGR